MWWFRRRKRQNRDHVNTRPAMSLPPQVACFSYSDLQSATENFAADKKLEEGQFGEVYKGELSDGTKLSVKKLSPRYQQQEPEIFVSEVSSIVAAEHQNVVKLKGFCLEAGEQFLLYEFLEQHRPLSDILFKGDEVISWKRRMDIACGIARGLTHLHEKAKVIHGDIRASNILIDEDFIPKISEVGLTYLLPDDDSHVNARQSGTFGYMAPEYALEGKLTDKVDVYSFGVLMLELISGRSNWELSFPMEKVSLLQWTWKLYTEGRIMELVDPRLLGDYPSDEVLRALHIALLCTQESAKSRPGMVQTRAMLTGDWDISVFPSKPGLLEELPDS